MKVSINYEVVNRIWGGGNRFVISLIDHLKKNNHDVIHHLNDNDIDIILIIDPRKYLKNIKYGAGAVQKYIWLKNKQAIVVHRINECDERKGEKNINKLLKNANYVADHTIFIASWLKSLDLWMNTGKSSIILNGGNKNIFNSNKNVRWNGKFPIKLVTHHWGGNHQKGMDIYNKFDQLMDDIKWKNKIEFSYIGNIPGKKVFKNIKHILPCSGKKLSNIISSHHLYVTGSINEPGGMHHIEGALCGLPVLYRNSGSLPEYCEGFGVSFDDDLNVVSALKKIISRYNYFKDQVTFYDRSAEKMCVQYHDLFKNLLEKKFELLEKRNLFKKPLLILRNQFPF